MILTEAEAKTKWCPMVRLGYSEFSNWNRIYQGKENRVQHHLHRIRMYDVASTR